MHRQLGLDLKTRRLHREALHKAPRKRAVTRQDVPARAPKQARKESGQHDVAPGMPTPIGPLVGGLAQADHHVMPIKHLLHQQGRARRVVGRITIDHEVHIGFDVRELTPHHIALAAQLYRPHDRTGLASTLCRGIGGLVVEHIDIRIGQGRPHARHHFGDSQLLVVTGDKHGNSWSRHRHS